MPQHGGTATGFTPVTVRFSAKRLPVPPPHLTSPHLTSPKTTKAPQRCGAFFIVQPPVWIEFWCSLAMLSLSGIFPTKSHSHSLRALRMAISPADAAMTAKDVWQLIASIVAPFVAAGGAFWLYALQHRERISCFITFGYGHGWQEISLIGIHNRSSQPVAIRQIRYRSGMIFRKPGREQHWTTTTRCISIFLISLAPARSGN